jgi:hypothetical protein
MLKGACKSGPVVVGGVGGSGTRVVAEILMKLGLYMGEVRYPDNDNFWFTAMFFSRPGWFTDFENVKQNRVFRAFNIFEDLMSSHFHSRCKMIQTRLRGMVFFGLFWRSPVWSGLRRFLYQGFSTAFRGVPLKTLEMSDYWGWGWKEPVSHIYLEPLSEYFHDLRYIHVVRDGLDMAFSHNTYQLEVWAKLFGISVPSEKDEMARAALNYWVAANKRAVEVGTRLLGDRFFLMKFEDLCFAPRQEIERLFRFLGLDLSAMNCDEFSRLVKIPKSIGRHKKKDLSIFKQKDIIAKEKLERRLEQIKSGAVISPIGSGL